ncbi:MAG TPA: cytochrome c oxidase accessory protein CcoG [Azospirillaceae bacterium]|nr:cytochrome c oxidase accessory protein CcoG [Azospirillaceae bacterium]
MGAQILEKPTKPKPAPQKPAADVVPLYADRVKVQPRSVKGFYRTVKWAVLGFCLAVYYLVPWLRWDRGPGAPDQAVLIDLTAPRAYFFGIEIWPQEVYFITGLLVMGSLALFLATALAGRLWCGYACPQTVWTDLFMLVERWIEGDRGARIRLDKQPLSWRKAGLKTAKHAVWLLISLATGGAWVMYFGDAPTVVRDFFTGAASLELYFFVGMFTATTYILAGWAREQVCTYMCPWPRFQGAMLDRHSLVVTYQAWRGERRGPHKAGTSWEGRGDCIDCAQCVAVCPTGIDIRDGQQLECIGCGLCIDSCNEIMDKVGRPQGLIRFDTLAAQEAKAAASIDLLAMAAEARDAATVRQEPWRLLRPRVVIYAGLLALTGVTMLAGLMLRTTVEVSVLRDRAPLFVQLSDGGIRNAYTLKILNKRRERLSFALTAEGIEGAVLSVQGAGEAAPGGAVTLAAGADAVETFRVFVTAPKAALAGDTTPITFHLREPTRDEGADYDAVFLGPAARHK